MKAKRNIKLRTDMYEDTKFKIIDTMPERDTINYIWTRILTLCGKVNDAEGRLYVTKNVPYTIEILAIEFNRTKEQVANAMNIFIDLNMVCRDENSIFKVCNWNKYQGGSPKVNNNDEKHETILKEELLEQNKEQNLAQDNKAASSDKLTKNDDESKREARDNKNKRNIIDITNGDFVKDKIEDNKVGEKITKTKPKRKSKKKNGESNNIIVSDNGEDSEEINCFHDGDYKVEGRRVAIFKYR